MRLHFLRHGEAEERRPGLPDGERRLTPAGIREMRDVALGMRALDLRLDAILTSPLARARDTARIVAEALGMQSGEEAWIVGARVADLAEGLAGMPPGARVLLVGHEPDFSVMVGDLVGGGAVRMRKAGLACVEVASLAPGGGELQWLLTPAQLRRLGSS
jgi:phosphohistidine phosphatase